jgi:glycosyl transferase family 25
MAHLNRVCDKVYVINLEKDKERLKEFNKCMEKNSIKYERFNAVDGKKVQRSDKLSDYCNTFCPDGMKGCALSHVAIWESMIENDYKNVMVFEDDAIIEADFDRKFQDVWNHLPKDYDIVYFGCIFGCSDNSLANTVYKKVTGIETEEINDFIQTSQGSAGTHGYMISLEGAKKFVNKPINWHIDSQMLSWIKTYDYTAYSVNNNMVETSQDNGTLSDSYPILLNSLLRNFTVNNLKKPSTLDWSLSENHIKLGLLNINTLIIILMIVVLLIPTKYSWVVGAWLAVELLASGDIKNTVRYMVLLGVPIGLKYAYLKISAR